MLKKTLATLNLKKMLSLNFHYLGWYTYLNLLICCVMVFLSFFALSAERESISNLSQPVKGKAPEYKSGEVAPTLDGSTALTDEETLSEASKFGDLKVIVADEEVVDLDVDEDPKLKIEALVDSETEIVNPLFTMSILSENKDGEIERTAVSSDETLNTIRFSDFAPGKQIEIEIKAKLIPFTLTGFDRIGQPVVSNRTYTLTIPPRTPGVRSNQFFNPLNSPFPKTGFEGSTFELITPYLAQDYAWQTDHPELIEIDSSNGIAKIKLIAQPPVNPKSYTSITVQAEREGESGTETISHTFALERWFVYGQDVLSVGVVLPVNYSTAFNACKAYADKTALHYSLPRLNYLVALNNDGTEQR